jgi:hypothetical protein
MTTKIQEICAMCKHFKMKEYPQHAREGLGRCMGYDNDRTALINPFVPWGRKACVRFALGSKITERLAWIEKQQAKRQHEATPTEVPTREKK